MTRPACAAPVTRSAAGETVAVLAAWAVVQWLAWEVLGRLHLGGAVAANHHHASAVAGVTGGVLVILVAGRVTRSAVASRRQSVTFAAAASLASLVAGAGHIAGDTAQHAVPLLALWAFISVVQALTATLACLVWREVARAWRPRRAVFRTSSTSPGRGIDTRPRLLLPSWSDSPRAPRAPPRLALG